jgi:hypothetical protein
MHEPCARHGFDSAEDVCRRCGRDFCGDCLVYSFGPTAAPYCRACALAASGVSHRNEPVAALSRREIRDRHRRWLAVRAAGPRTVEAEPESRVPVAADRPAPAEPMGFEDDRRRDDDPVGRRGYVPAHLAHEDERAAF